LADVPNDITPILNGHLPRKRAYEAYRSAVVDRVLKQIDEFLLCELNLLRG
jgi:hypothetical protein